MTYHIGQRFQYIAPRGFTGADLPKPVWHALTVQPGREASTRDMLANHGIHAQFPVDRRTRFRRGKKVVTAHPVVTRVVYAQFKAEPQWDVLKQRRLITGVYSRGSWPIEIPYDIIRAVMGLPTVAEELEAARQEMLRVREGDKAEITAGPLSGFMVDIQRVAHGRAWFTTLAGLKGEARVQDLERKT